MEWRKEYQIHVPAIDHSHRHLFNKTNELISAFIAKNLAEMRLILSYLANHLIENCDEEEQLMAKYNYPFAEEHIREHTRLIENLMNIKEESERDNCDVTYLALRAQLLLLDWFSGHVANSDRHAGRHIIKTSPTDHMGANTLRLRAFLDAETQNPNSSGSFTELPLPHP